MTRRLARGILVGDKIEGRLSELRRHPIRQEVDRRAGIDIEIIGGLEREACFRCSQVCPPGPIALLATTAHCLRGDLKSQALMV
jgi:hypothetical protein